ncbi:SDR family NAD(P)-dependent oxidoreductase [Streptomyces sp. NPDC005820]|uniref:SDR family NAD(P)-dependent oxidoreductase n=1 Tax=Streptomyces sp. NPDC005820 TaxID=3157069 RepID=UPI00340872A8
MPDVTDRPVVVVTGAAGDLGSALVSSQLAAGSVVVALDRAEDALKGAADAWSAEHSPDRIRTFVVDQTSRPQVDEAVEAVRDEFGRIDGLVANAGYAKFGSFLDMPAKVWDRHVEVNLSGTFHVCQSVARAMAAARTGGWITVISSNLALSHTDFVSAYNVTKAALLSLVRSASAELGVHRIRVNAVLPGAIATAMTRQMLDEPGVTEGLLQLTPLGRLGKPDDVTSAVAYLASPDARWITGAALVVDGGQSIYGQPAWMRQDRSTPHEPRWLPNYQPR